MDNQEREQLRREIFKPREQANTEVSPSIDPELLKLFNPKRLERIKKKALRKYKASQDKQWRNFLEAVSK